MKTGAKGRQEQQRSAGVVSGLPGASERESDSSLIIYRTLSLRRLSLSLPPSATSPFYIRSYRYTCRVCAWKAAAVRGSTLHSSDDDGDGSSSRAHSLLFSPRAANRWWRCRRSLKSTAYSRVYNGETTRTSLQSNSRRLNFTSDSLLFLQTHDCALWSPARPINSAKNHAMLHRARRRYIYIHAYKGGGGLARGLGVIVARAWRQPLWPADTLLAEASLARSRRLTALSLSLSLSLSRRVVIMGSG